MWEVCVVPSLPAALIPSFLPISVTLVPVLFSLQSSQKAVVSGWAYFSFSPALIKEPSVEHPPTRVLKIVNEWLK